MTSNQRSREPGGACADAARGREPRKSVVPGSVAPLRTTGGHLCPPSGRGPRCGEQLVRQPLQTEGDEAAAEDHCHDPTSRGMPPGSGLSLPARTGAATGGGAVSTCGGRSPVEPVSVPVLVGGGCRRSTGTLVVASCLRWSRGQRRRRVAAPVVDVGGAGAGVDRGAAEGEEDTAVVGRPRCTARCSASASADHRRP